MDDQHMNTMVVIRNLLEEEASSEKKECSFFWIYTKKCKSTLKPIVSMNW